MIKGSKMSKESRRKISIALVGRKTWNKGIPHSEETRKKMSESRIGSKNSFFGRRHSKETKKKISDMAKKRIGSKNPNWKGGKHFDGDGYIIVYNPSHPNANKKGFVRGGRLIMEKHLGRYLSPAENVHHRNFIKSDDRIENLQLFASNSEHRKFHNVLQKRNLSGRYVK